MKYSLHKNWIESFELMVRKPVLLLPFIIIACFEGIALELAYFCVRPPLSLITNPIIRKFFGEQFLHYPANMILLPRIFYYLQIVIYIFLGVLLTAVTINIFKNIRSGLPVKANAIVKNTLSRYVSFLAYGVMMMIFMAILQKGEAFVFSKFMVIASKFITLIPQLFYTILFFISNIVLQTLFILTIPLIVLEKKSFLKAVAGSIVLGLRNFFKIFSLIIVPFLAYLPVMVLRSDPIRLVDKLFPETTAIVTVIGIIVSVFADCFIILCASRFLTDMEKR